MGHDRTRLANMSRQGQASTGHEALGVLADRIYFSREEILACERVGIAVLLPMPLASDAKVERRFDKRDFVYEPEADTYRCPAGERIPTAMLVDQCQDAQAPAVVRLSLHEVEAQDVIAVKRPHAGAVVEPEAAARAVLLGDLEPLTTPDALDPILAHPPAVCLQHCRVDDPISPRAGIVLKPLPNLAFYGSYSVSYLPSSGDQIGTFTSGLVIAKPEQFENTEVGVKYDSTPKFQITAAAYNLDRFNQRLADPNNPGFFILSGRTNTQGFEIGANGYLTDWWQVAGGYALTDGKIASATSASIVAGNKVGLVPFNAFTLWNKFDLTPQFSVGIGTITSSHTFATSDNTIRLPGYTRIDFGLFYEIKESVRAQINLENVLDRRYIVMADNNNISPGATRTIRAQIIARF